MYKCDGDHEGELVEGDNGKGYREIGEGELIASKGKRVVLKGEPLGKGEPIFCVSHFPFKNKYAIIFSRIK